MWYSLFYNNVLDYIKPYIDLDLGSVENNPPPNVPRLLVCPRFTVIKTKHKKSKKNSKRAPSTKFVAHSQETVYILLKQETSHTHNPLKQNTEYTDWIACTTRVNSGLYWLWLLGHWSWPLTRRGILYSWIGTDVTVTSTTHGQRIMNNNTKWEGSVASRSSGYRDN